MISAEQKQQMVQQLTETMVAIEGENLRQVTWVVIEEVRSGDWGIGGQSLTHRRRQDPRPRPLPSSRCSSHEGC
jgi:4-oxalocrotonate tautomerase